MENPGFPYREVQVLSSSPYIQNDSVAHSATSPIGTARVYPGISQPRPEADRPPLSSAEVKQTYEWRWTSNHPTRLDVIPHVLTVVIRIISVFGEASMTTLADAGDNTWGAGGGDPLPPTSGLHSQDDDTKFLRHLVTELPNCNTSQPNNLISLPLHFLVPFLPFLRPVLRLFLYLSVY